MYKFRDQCFVLNMGLQGTVLKSDDSVDDRYLVN